jgi:O-antigen ligase
VIFVLLGPVAYIVPKGLWIPILLLLVVYGGPLKTISVDDIKALLKKNAVFLAVPCYALLSTLWAIEPANAAKTALKLLGYVILAILVVFVMEKTSEQQKRSIMIWSAVGFIAAPMVVWIDLALDGSLLDFARSDPFIASTYNRGGTIAACMLLPVTIGLLRYSHKMLAMALVGMSVVTILLLESESAKLALIAGGVMYFLVRRFGRLFWPTIVVIAGLFVVMPAIFGVQISDRTLCTLCEYKCSAAHRLVIYNYSSQRIFEKPLAGWGMDAARSIPSGKETAIISGCAISGRPDGRFVMGNWMPLHPHNAALQAWLELGGIGVFLIVAALFVLARSCSRQASFERNRDLVAATFVMLFFIFNISFGFWQGWLLLSMVMLCALMSLTTRQAAPDHSSHRTAP